VKQRDIDEVRRTFHLRKVVMFSSHRCFKAARCCHLYLGAFATPAKEGFAAVEDFLCVGVYLGYCCSWSPKLVTEALVAGTLVPVSVLLF
jgi:hypothetical protein